MAEQSSWKLLKKVLEGSCSRLAETALRGYTPDSLRKWQQKPLGEDFHLGNGSRNPIDIVDVLFDDAFMRNREFCFELIERYIERLEQAMQQERGTTDQLRERLSGLKKTA